MSRLARAAMPRAIASLATAFVATVVSIPYTGMAATVVEIDVVVVVGWPALLYADALARRGGAA